MAAQKASPKGKSSAKPAKKVGKSAVLATANQRKKMSAPVPASKSGAKASAAKKVPAAPKAVTRVATKAETAAAPKAQLASAKDASKGASKGASKNGASTRKGSGGAMTAASAAAASLAKVKPGVQSAAELAAQAAGESVCREVACEGLATTAGYCRLHYIKNWKKIKRKELILKEKKLNQYIEELVAKYPDKYIEAIRQDLASDKDFAKVISDLDLDETMDDFDVEQEGVESMIDSIKRDFEDEGEGF